MIRFIALVLCVAFSATGCKCSDAPAKKAKSALSKAAKAKRKKASAAQIKNLPVPTEEDYEEQVEKDITATNMDSELDKLEKEIGESPAAP